MSFLTICSEIGARNHKEKQLLNELETLRARVAQVDSLQQENESLQAEIGRLRKKQDVQAVSPIKRTALGELSPNKPTTEQLNPTRKGPHGDVARASESVKYKAVVARCKELDTKYKATRRLLDDHRLKLRKRSETIEAWARHSDALQRTIDKLVARLKTRPFPRDGVSTAQVDEDRGTSTVDDELVDIAAFKRPSPDSTFEHELPSSPPTLGAVLGQTSALPFPHRILSEPPPRLPIDDTVRCTDSGKIAETDLPATDDVDLPPCPDQTVEAHLATIKVEVSSDSPILVSSRSARKRKHGREDSETGKLQKVKLEHSSSSGPEVIREFHHHSPAESIDFDEEVHVPTPRKRRTLPKHRYENADTTSGEITKPRLLFQDHATLEGISAPDESHTPSKDVVALKPQNLSVLLDTSLDKKRAGRAITTGSSVGPDVFASRLALGVKDLAEDGDAEKGDATAVQLQRPVVKGRLDALLDSALIKDRPPLNRDGPSKVQFSRAIPVHDDNTGVSFSTASKCMYDGNTRPQDTKRSMRTGASLSPQPSMSRERSPKKPSILREDMPRGRTIIREDVSLREQPIERLRPEDFKPNPLYNDGLTFVYDEVVRGKDARAGLSGCIDPNCCGKTFRHFAEAELKSAGSSVTRRAEDVGLMERYLGDEAFRLGMMTREEREAAWLKAKTWELANKFGKHRHRYSRMPTPPGFWSMDFPNTQERAEELRQAEAIRTALVSERHREAMRCKGSWLFRDEEPR